MHFGFCLLLLGTVITAKRTQFELIPKWNDLNLFQQHTLGVPTAYNRSDQCAQYCAGVPQCSLFSFNQGVQTCQMYGDIMHIEGTPALQQPGKRHYAYGTALCPLKKGFFMLRSANTCVKFIPLLKTYSNAIGICQALGGRMIVLEDEDKASAVIGILDALGKSNTSFHLGLDDRDTEGQFVWADGRNMTRLWWLNDEPNGGDGENCASLYQGGLRDEDCNVKKSFVCEMPL